MGMLAALVLAGAPHALDDAIPGTVTPSTAWVIGALRGWTSPGPVSFPADAGAMTLECLESSGEKDTVGVGQALVIDAPLADVVALLDDWPHYTQLFPDLEDVHVVKGSEDANRFTVFWEQHVPIFPNVKYESTYVVERAATRVTWRYQLEGKSDLKALDGLMVLEADGPGRTRYSEYDFIDGAWGFVPRGTVWKETVKGLARADLALKLKAEHAAWTYGQVRKAADALADGLDFGGCFDRRHARTAVAGKSTP